MTVLDEALAAHHAGLSVQPPKEDGTKAPDAAEWVSRQTIRATEDEVRRWYANGRTGLGVITGAVSGGLEMFEFEGRAIDAGLGEAFIDAAEASGLGELVSRIAEGYTERTPSGGLHWLFRTDAPVTAKLASGPDRLCLIESKGEGGYTITAPSYGSVHPTGGPWELVAGGFDSIATITPQEHAELHRLAATFDQAPRAKAREPRSERSDGSTKYEVTPGDDYNARVPWGDILEPHGWRRLFTTRGGNEHWVRPGKDVGTSATINDNGEGVLYVFTGSTAFEPDAAYSRFAAFSVLNHGGDLKSAAAALENAGYGKVRESNTPGVKTKAATGADESDLFRIWTTRELLAADRTFRWRARGMLTNPSYGMVGGAKKTLKSYVDMFINIGVAAGVPILGQFEVDEAAPVLTYVGEGGRIPYTVRLERVARAMSVNLADIPLYQSYDVAPVLSERFTESLARDLRDLEPGLVSLDPLYAFHGAKTNSSNLHEEGALLSSLSAPCSDAGACLLVVNHFNKTGLGRGLDRITQAGGQEWVDSWVLLSHRATPDVAQGQFQLLMEVGSRQWGGAEWDLDLSLGRFDVERGEFVGDITWALRRHVEDTDGQDETEANLLALVADRPLELTKEELAKGAGGNLKKARDLVTSLQSRGLIKVTRASRVRSDGKAMSVWVYVPGQPASDPGRSETESDAEWS